MFSNSRYKLHVFKRVCGTYIDVACTVILFQMRVLKDDAAQTLSHNS